MIRFIHAADLHLDQPFKKISKTNPSLYEKLRQATTASFNNIIETAINETVDFVVVSGDIYHNEPASLQAQFTFRQGMERLAEAGIPAIVCHGNHDYVQGDAHRLAMPDNVYIFPDHVDSYHFQAKSSEHVMLAGFSYGQAWIERDMVQDFPKRQAGIDFQIGVIHGENQRHEGKHHYAPFNVSDLTALGYDYWALGHIHKRQILADHPPVVYPGNIQGSSFKESGPKGVYLVSLQKYQEAELEFVETTDWQFSAPLRDLPKLENIEDLRNVVERALHEEVMYAKNEAVNLVIRLAFRTDGDEESLYWWDRYAEELRDQLQWSLSNQDQYRDQEIYLADLKLVIDERSSWSYSKAFQDALQQSFHRLQAEGEWEQLIQPLMQNQLWQRYMLPQIDGETFKADVLNRAVEKIIVRQAVEQKEN
ncbi:transposase [Aerococcus sanguinicola]|uniref:Transposase n=1 Tax=Aerococcus sanguinicola TaxID=119206 RepID=A0A2I1MTT6_9LACT|nr:DNA repair exonuclease [Aerococcus sanguinicola]PKZ23543.1 transposase [Aerococcus sanguinicola]